MEEVAMQRELVQPGPLLENDGSLAQVGWARQPVLDCNLEKAAFYPGWRRIFQRFRLKRWEYYALFTPRRCFSATIASLGYAANVFVYTLDFRTGDLHEEGLVLPDWTVRLPRNSTTGETVYESRQAHLRFTAGPGQRRVLVDWPAFHDGRGIRADLALDCPPGHESLNIVIPIEGRRFYYNRKINCLPAEGLIHYGDVRQVINPRECLGSLDWGRGAWAYRSFWNWASASGFLPDGRTVGLNLGCGFGDTSAATEDALVLDGRVHKLDAVLVTYDHAHYMKPWRFVDSQGRLDLTFIPFKERVARSNLYVIVSEVHQMFGRFTGAVIGDDGEEIAIDGLVGFAEEHQARW
jgi:hypothetical protein